MADPIWNPVTQQHEYPMETIYADREAERTRAYLESVHGPIPVDASQEGTDAAAQGAQQMPGAEQQPVRPPIESASEAVRNKVQALADQPMLYKAADTALRTITGDVVGLEDLTPEGIQRFNNRQHGVSDFSKMADPLGNTAEAVARENVKRQGGTDEQADMVAGVVSLAAGILFPMPGKGEKLVERAAGAAEKAGAQAMKGVNPSRLEGVAPDVERTIKNIGFFNAGRMERGVVSHGETIAKANEALTLQQALKLDVGKMDLATVQTAIAGHYKAASIYLTDVAKRAAAGDAAAGKEFWGAFAVATDLAEKDALIGTALGRGLESRKIALTEINVGGTSRMKEFADRIAGSNIDPVVAAQRYLELNPRQRSMMLTQAANAWKAGQDAVYEAWINSLLSGPQTHAANIVSNSITAAWAPGERFLGALASAGEAGVRGTDRTVYFGETAQMLYGMVEAAKDGLRVMGRSLTQGAGGVGQKVERPPAITAANFGLNPEGFLGAGVDYLGAVIRTPSRSLVAEDEFFKAINYRMQLRALAYREASQEGLSGSAFAARVKQIIEEPPAAAKSLADTFALAQTFNQDIGDLGPLAKGLGKGAAAFADNVPMGRVILPFVRTPANILNYASERTPILNLIATGLAKEITSGGPEQRALALGKVAAGSMASMVVAGYVASAIAPDNPVPYMTTITGEGPRDPKQRALLQTLGWQPYSVWTGSEYVSYKRLDPLGTVMGIVATGTEMLGQLPQQGVAEVTTAMSVAVGKAMLSKTFLEGLSSFLDTMEGKPEDFKKFAEGLARSGVPALARQTTRSLDPVRREMDGLYDHWRSGLPGYDGPPVLNLWGDPVMLAGGLGPDIISPLYTSTGKPDDVTEWLLQNRVPVTGAPKVVAGSPPQGTQLTEPTAKVGIKLTREEHHRLGVLIGKGGEAGTLDGGPDLGGLAGLPPLKDAIREIIAGPGTGGPDGSKADLIRARVQQYKQAAIMQLRKESPMLDEHLAALEKRRIDLKVDESMAPAPKGPPGLADALKNLIPSLGR